MFVWVWNSWPFCIKHTNLINKEPWTLIVYCPAISSIKPIKQKVWFSAFAIYLKFELTAFIYTRIHSQTWALLQTYHLRKRCLDENVQRYFYILEDSYKKKNNSCVLKESVSNNKLIVNLRYNYWPVFSWQTALSWLMCNLYISRIKTIGVKGAIKILSRVIHNL